MVAPQLHHGAEKLLGAIVEALAQSGPNLKLFNATPAATYAVQGRATNAAPGWWAVFAADLSIDARPELGSHRIELTFTPCSERVHGGQAWTWTLDYVSALGGTTDDFRLALKDDASYPQSGYNMLIYSAIKLCRDELIRRLANILERPVVLYGSWWSSISRLWTQVLPSDDDEVDVAAELPAATVNPVAAAGTGMWRPDTDRPAATDSPGPAPMPRWEPAPSNRGQRDVRSDAGPSVPSYSGFGAAPPAAFAASPSRLEAPAAFWDAAPGEADGAGATDLLSAAAARDAGLAGFAGGGSVAMGRSRSPRTTLVSSFEDKVDLLRSRLPQRSSDQLRQMLRAHDGDVQAVLEQLS